MAKNNRRRKKRSTANAKPTASNNTSESISISENIDATTSETIMESSTPPIAIDITNIAQADATVTNDTPITAAPQPITVNINSSSTTTETSNIKPTTATTNSNNAKSSSKTIYTSPANKPHTKNNTKQTTTSNTAKANSTSSGKNKTNSGQNPSQISYSFGKFERFFAYLGLKVIRKCRFAKRRLFSVIMVISYLFKVLKSRFNYAFKLFLVRNNISFDSGIELWQSIKKESINVRKNGILPYITYWVMVVLALIFKLFMKFFSSVNYVAPTLAVVVFMLIIKGTLNMSFALRVEYNGEDIGYIADESIFEVAEKQMLGRIVFEDYIKPENTIPTFSIAAVHPSELLNEDELTNELIKASGNELAQGAGLYIDNTFIGAVKDHEKVLSLLDTLKSRYKSALDEEAASNSSADEDEDEDEDDEEEETTTIVSETIEFVKNVEIVDGLYPVSSVVDIEKLEEMVDREEEGQRIYTVVKGDAPTTIAQKNGVAYSQLKALNPTIEKSLLIGQEVLVQKSIPVLEVKVIREEVSEEPVSFKIEQIQDQNQMSGYVKVTQKGEAGLSLVTSEVTYVDGIEVSRTVLDTRITQEPINEKVIVGGKQPTKYIDTSSTYSASTNFIWPVGGGYVSCGIRGYWGHTGMDIAANVGTPVYASASGTVTKAVYNSTGYGYHIIINHGGGVETLYAHNSKLNVKVGDWVEQGQLIASVGRTGRVTGAHLHFEVRVNGRYMDPEKYVGSRNPY